MFPPNGEDVNEPDVVDVSEINHSPNWVDDSGNVEVEALISKTMKAGNPTDVTYVVYQTPTRETGTVVLYNCSESAEPVILFS